MNWKLFFEIILGVLSLNLFMSAIFDHSDAGIVKGAFGLIFFALLMGLIF